MDREQILVGLYGEGEGIPLGMAFIFENLYETHSLIRSFLSLKDREDFYKKSYFFRVFFLSSSYSTALLARQLFSTTKGDHSLKTMWQELSDIEKKSFYGINDFVENEVPKTFKQLNKNILHNEFSSVIELLNIVDRFLEYAAEIIGIFSQKSESHIRPPRESEDAFCGLERIFNVSEIEFMKSFRRKYLRTIWSKTHHVYGHLLL